MRFSKCLGYWPVIRGNHLSRAVIFLLACVGPLSAQSQELTPPKVEGKVIVGGAIFGDDIDHKIVGGAARVYLTRRLSVEPEYLYLRNGERDQDHLVQASVAYDFTDSTKRFVAYGIAGVGVLHHKGRFFGNDFETGEPRVFDTSFTTWTTSVGGGVRVFLTKRLFISPELRVGREPTVRGTISVGYVFSGRN